MEDIQRLVHEVVILTSAIIEYCPLDLKSCLNLWFQLDGVLLLCVHTCDLSIAHGYLTNLFGQSM